MNISIKSPYENSAYDALSDPDTGPFPLDGACSEAVARYTALLKKRGASPALRAAWEELRAPAKRIVCDIFIAAVHEERQALKELEQLRHRFTHTTVASTPTFGEELVIWPPAPALPADFATREVALSLSTLYEAPERRLECAAFDS